MSIEGTARQGRQTLVVQLRPRVLFAMLATTTAALVVAGTVANLALQRDPEGPVGAVARRLILDAEATVPAYVSGAIAGLIALLLLARSFSAWSSRARLAGLRWLVLAAGASFVSLDEVIHTHEEWDDVLRIVLGDPTLDRAWTIPALIGLACVVGFGLPALRRETTRGWWLLGALVFAAGAVGVEWLSRPYEPPESARLGYVLAVALEEGLELLGLAILAYAALTPFAADHGAVPLVLGDPPSPKDRARTVRPESAMDPAGDLRPRTSPHPRSPGPPAAR